VEKELTLRDKCDWQRIRELHDDLEQIKIAITQNNKGRYNHGQNGHIS
jgi:hypothetical protein